MSEQPETEPVPGLALLALYDEAMPRVYGYLLSRSGDRSLAEDLTADTFLTAADAIVRASQSSPSTAWLIGVARHKLADHWRRKEREDRGLRLVHDSAAAADEDPWDEHLDAFRADAVLAELGTHHRAALTLRYLDGLSVPEVADCLHRTVHATEALLIRAKAASRAVYQGVPGHD